MLRNFSKARPEVNEELAKKFNKLNAVLQFFEFLTALPG
jgi:hypothetical protein